MDNTNSSLSALRDIREVELSSELTTEEKKQEYLRQMGNSTVHKVGTIEVECIFGDMKLENMLNDLICR